MRRFLPILGLLVVLFACSPARAAAPTIVQTSPSTCFASSASTITCAFASNVTAGHTILACLGTAQAVTTVNTPTMTGETFTKITGMSNAGASTQGQVSCYATNSAVGGHNSLTWTDSTADDMHVHMAEISGQSGSPQDATGNTNGTTCSVSTSASTTTANDLVIAFFYDNNANHTITAGSGYSQMQQTNNTTGGDVAFSEDKSVSATGTQTATCSGNSTDNLAQGIIAIAGSGGGTTVTGFDKQRRYEQVDQ